MNGLALIVQAIVVATIMVCVGLMLPESGKMYWVFVGLMWAAVAGLVAVHL